jgi:hypothetical protein
LKKRIVVLACLLLATVAVRLRADWIVTRDGDRFEITGSWQLKGKLAVFTLPDGTLSSVRADRIDSEASRKLTDKVRDDAAAAAAPAPIVVKPTRKSVIVLTDKDFEKAPPAAEEAAKGAGDKTKAAAGAADGKAAKADLPLQEVPKAVEITNWSRVPAAETKIDGLELKGTLRNGSQRYLTEVAVTVSLFDETGTILGTFPASVENHVLPPSESSSFQVAATGVYAFATLRWDTHGQAFRELPEPKTPGTGAEATPGTTPPAPAPAAPGTATAAPVPPTRAAPVPASPPAPAVARPITPTSAR